MFMNIIFSYIFLSMGLNPTVVLEIKCCMDIFYLVIRLRFIKKMIGFPIYKFVTKVMAPMIAISIIPIAVMFAMSSCVNSNWVHLILTIVVFYIVYIPFVFFVGLTQNERNGITKMVYAKVRKR